VDQKFRERIERCWSKISGIRSKRSSGVRESCDVYRDKKMLQTSRDVTEAWKCYRGVQISRHLKILEIPICCRQLKMFQRR